MRPEIWSSSMPINRIPGGAGHMNLPIPQPGSRTSAFAGTPSRAMPSWMAVTTVGDV